MSAISDFMEAKILNDIFRSADTVRPSGGNVHIALFTAATDDAGGGTEVPLTNGYGRVAVAQVDGSWSAPADAGGPQLINNLAAITFPQASGGNWGLIGWVGIYDAATAGNLLFHGPLVSTRQIDDGDTFQFAIGDLDITMD